MAIFEKIQEIIQSERVLFTTPGHSGGKGVLSEFKELIGKKVFKADLSEIEEMDNLQKPSGIIKASLERATKIYGTGSTFYLTNGSTSGIISLMLATVNRHAKVLIARNAHKSVINALTLSGAFPVWLNPEWDDYWNIPSNISPKKVRQKLDEVPDIKAVWITSPTYEGIVSDIETISEICMEKNVLLIVDEAHGALWNFSESLPTSSIHLGADACVQSLHKTGSCFTQGAVLHLSKNSRINSEKVAKSLNVINTTSPSYLILSSIEASIEYLNSLEGRKKVSELLNNIEETKTFLSMNIDVEFLGNSKNFAHDPTKIFLGIKNVSGNDLADMLLEKFNIEVELDNNRGVLALTGIGTSKKKLDKLACALINSEKNLKKTGIKENIRPFVEPEVVFTPAEAFNKKSEKVEISKTIGLISAETIVNYPPGIPLLIAGERIKTKHLEFFFGRKEIEVIMDN